MSLSRTSSESKRTSSILPTILQGVTLQANGSKNFPITFSPCDHDRGKRRLIYNAQSGQSTSTPPPTPPATIMTWCKNKWIAGCQFKLSGCWTISLNLSMGKEYTFFSKENLHLCPLLFAVFPRMLRVSHSLELDLFPCTQDGNLSLKCKHNDADKIKMNLTSAATGNVVYFLMLSHWKEVN